MTPARRRGTRRRYIVSVPAMLWLTLVSVSFGLALGFIVSFFLWW